MVVIWSDLSWSETWIFSRYENRLNGCDNSMTWIQTNALGDAICENVLQILDIGAPKPRFWKGPDQLLLAGTLENDRPAGETWENEPHMMIRELQEFNTLFAQMDIWHQKLIKCWSRDPLICERVIGKWTPTPPGVEFWRTKIKFYCAGHRKTSTATTVWNCRFVTLRGKIKGLKKK